MNSTAPLLVVFAGPNGAGKSTLRGHLFADSPIPFVNADVIAEQRGIGTYEAADIAETERRRLFEARASFMFESVFSDPVGAKVAFLETARAAGYHVIVHFVGLASPEHSLARVTQRVNEGGHDVPNEKSGAPSRFLDPDPVYCSLQIPQFQSPYVLLSAAFVKNPDKVGHQEGSRVLRRIFPL